MRMCQRVGSLHNLWSSEIIDIGREVIAKALDLQISRSELHHPESMTAESLLAYRTRQKVESKPFSKTPQ